MTLVWLAGLLAAMAALAWGFRFAGQAATGNAPRFRDMPYGVAFGYVLGVAVLAVIVAGAEGALDEEAVIAACRARMANFKVPKQVLFVDHGDDREEHDQQRGKRQCLLECVPDTMLFSDAVESGRQHDDQDDAAHDQNQQRLEQAQSRCGLGFNFLLLVDGVVQSASCRIASWNGFLCLMDPREELLHERQHALLAGRAHESLAPLEAGREHLLHAGIHGHQRGGQGLTAFAPRRFRRRLQWS